MVLLTLGNDSVTVNDVLVGDFWVDTDSAPEPDEGFRTRVWNAAGEEVFRRNTTSPVLVRDFLSHYSDIAGFDLLTLMPDLGAFHVLVPTRDDAARVSFEIRQEDGSYLEVGSWDPSTAPTEAAPPPEFVTGWTTLVSHGPPAEMLDIVLVGDGYTEAEQAQWQSDADSLAAALIAAYPLNQVADRINIHRLDAISNESGASYDCIDECRFRDIAFRSVFAVNFINEMLERDYRSTTLFQLGQHTLDRALALTPVDLAIVLVNSEKSGGMSIHHAAVSTGSDTWTHTGIHEFGHLLGLLGDEYVADECIRSAAMGLPRNITDAPTSPRWQVWLDASTPLPTPEASGYDDVVGAFSGAWNCPDLYRPVELCRMKSSSTGEFCPVCTEQLLLQATRYTDLATVAVTQRPDGDALSFDTLGLARTLRVSTDGTTWMDAAEPLVVAEDEVWVDITVSTPLIREDAGRLTERVHLQRPASTNDTADGP